MSEKKQKKEWKWEEAEGDPIAELAWLFHEKPEEEGGIRNIEMWESPAMLDLLQDTIIQSFNYTQGFEEDDVHIVGISTRRIDTTVEIRIKTHKRHLFSTSDFCFPRIGYY